MYSKILSTVFRCVSQGIYKMFLECKNIHIDYACIFNIILLFFSFTLPEIINY